MGVGVSERERDRETETETEGEAVYNVDQHAVNTATRSEKCSCQCFPALLPFIIPTG